MRKSGQFPEDSKTGCPAGIYDLAEGRIAAMDDAGIDVQILSYATPSAERFEPSLARELTRQANDAVAAAVSKYPDRLFGFATLPMLDPAAAARVPGLSGHGEHNRNRPRLLHHGLSIRQHESRSAIL
jgi:predicted TIM-barrel fold metal-dependent hydrolase